MGFAKVTRPALARTLQRPRLFKLLDKFSAVPLTWVCGPPGSGKTTLVSDYIGAKRRSNIWFQCDRGDADVATFFMYLAEAAPRHVRPLPAFGRVHRDGIENFARHFFRRLFARLRSSTTLVLDDLHIIAEEEALRDVLIVLANEVPAGNRAIVVSRTEPPVSLARHLLHGRLQMIDGSELRFSRREAEQLIRTVQSPRQQATDAQAALAMADGWAAGLVLLASQPHMPPRQRSRSDQALFDYFTREVVSTLDERARRVLQVTSLLPYFTAADARDLSGDADASVVVEQLFKSNYFTSRRRIDGQFVYEYHPLFRSYLSDTARTTLEPGTLMALQSAAAQIAERQGQLHAAFELYRSAGLGGDLASFVIRQAPTLLAQGRSQAVEEWYASVPKGSQPGWLLYWRGFCGIGWDYEAGCQFLERAFEVFRRETDQTGMIAAAAALLALDQGAGRIREMDRHGPLLDRLLDDSVADPDTSPPIVVAAMFGYVAFRQYRRADANVWAQRALALCRSIPDMALRGVLAVTWFQYGFSTALFDGAGAVADEMRAIWQDLRQTTTVRITAAVTLSIHAFQSGSPAYVAIVDDVLQLASESGAFYAARHATLGIGLLAATAAGDEETVARWLPVFRDDLPRMEHGYRNWYHQLAARRALRLGAWADAEHHRQEMFRYNFPGWIVTDVASLVVSARVLAAAGKTAESRDTLTQALSRARDAGSPMAVFMALTAQCELSAETTGAVDASPLAEAMQIGATHQILNSYAWSRAGMERLCDEALRRGIERDYTQMVIRVHGLRPSGRNSPTVAWPNQIIIATLPDFRIVPVGAAPSTRPRKAQRKPLELLKLLVVLGPKPVREERIADLLWPESSGDAAQFSLTTTIHRLRRLLASDDAVVRYDRTVALSSRVCWVDVFRLRELLAQLERSRSLDGQAGDAFDEISALYQGPLLADADDTWLVRERAVLASRLVKQMERIADIFATDGHAQAAAQAHELASHIAASSRGPADR